MRLLAKQDGKCAICGIDLPSAADKDACLDHDHKTGFVRGVLCRNCNGIEGKIYNLANRAKRKETVSAWLESLLLYYNTHTLKPTMVEHPSHKNEDEKRLRRNALARKRRLAKKEK